MGRGPEPRLDPAPEQPFSDQLPREGGLLHWVFEASLLLKGIFAAIEALSGVALLLTRHASITRVIDWLTRNELLEDPKEPLVSRLTHALQGFDAAAQHFYAIYLLGHGLVKLVVVILLARRITAAYPIGMAVFAGFIVYQLHRYSYTHSPVMLAMSAFDMFIIWLTWREWRQGLHEETAGVR